MGRYSILQLLVIVTAIALVLGLLLPPILKAREDARRMSCRGRLKQLALAIHNYHSAYQHLPAAMSGNVNNDFRLSGLVWLTPFLEEQALWESIASPFSSAGTAYPPMGLPPQDKEYAPWRTQMPSLQCPSDPSWSDRYSREALRTLAKTNYAFSVGDRVSDLYACKTLEDVRGLFAPYQITRFNDVSDGLSHTLCFAEISTASGKRLQGQFSIGHPRSLAEDPAKCFLARDPGRLLFYDSKQELSGLGRGGAFADGSGGYAMVHTVLPPNAPSCAIGETEPYSGVFSAGSYHPGGCNVVLADGSVQFVSETVDFGGPDTLDPSPLRVNTPDGIPIPSPYSVWGALGSRAGNDEPLCF
ncbi:MAG: DUF1559 domain-containing protein [Planctomycetota bacterium]